MFGLPFQRFARRVPAKKNWRKRYECGQQPNVGQHKEYGTICHVQWILQWSNNRIISGKRNQKNKVQKLVAFCFVVLWPSALSLSLDFCHPHGARRYNKIIINATRMWWKRCEWAGGCTTAQTVSSAITVRSQHRHVRVCDTEIDSEGCLCRIFRQRHEMASKHFTWNRIVLYHVTQR